MFLLFMFAGSTLIRDSCNVHIFLVFGVAGHAVIIKLLKRHQPPHKYEMEERAPNDLDKYFNKIVVERPS